MESTGKRAVDGRLRQLRHRSRHSGRIGIVLAIILGVSGVLGAGAWFAFPQLGRTLDAMADRASENAGDDFEAPAWDDVRREVLPVADPEPAAAEGEQGDGSEAPPPRPQVDPRVLEVADNLNKQFARNAGQETAFTDAYPRRALEAWIKDRAGIPADRRDHFIDSLVAASQGIGEDPLINRIGSVPDRVKAIQESLFAYRDEYLRRVEAVAQADPAPTSSADPNGTARADPRAAFVAERTPTAPGDPFSPGDVSSTTRADAAISGRLVGRLDDASATAFAPAERRRGFRRGLSVAHVAVLGVGVVALAVMLALIFLGGGRKPVRARQAEPGEQSA